MFVCVCVFGEPSWEFTWAGAARKRPNSSNDKQKATLRFGKRRTTLVKCCKKIAPAWNVNRFKPCEIILIWRSHFVRPDARQSWGRKEEEKKAQFGRAMIWWSSRQPFENVIVAVDCAKKRNKTFGVCCQHTLTWKDGNLFSHTRKHVPVVISPSHKCTWLRV